jgi:trigger factor
MAEEEKLSEVKNIVTIEDAGLCRKKVIVEIPEDTVKKASDQQYETLRREAMVPGFRKGRAPRRLLEKRFGKDTSEQIKLKLLADASEAALKDNNINVLRDPEIGYEKIQMPETGPFKFDFEVEVRPEFELPELEGIEIEKPIFEVTDEQIDVETGQLRKWSGLWTPREDGTIETDDQVTADVVLKIEGVEDEQKLQNTEIYVRANGFVGDIPVEKLDDLLAGAKVGDEKQVTVDVPKTYVREDYRGKKVDIRMTLKDVKWLKPAEINEAFLTKCHAQSEGELREKMRDVLTDRLEKQSRAEMTEQIYKYLLDNTSFDMPVNIVADQAASILQRQYGNLMMRGLSRQQIEPQMGRLQAASDEQAKKQLKIFFIMDKVAEKFGLEVTEEEINGQIAQLAIQQGQRPERMREEMSRDGSLAQFGLQVREVKCVAKLLESARIKEVQPEKQAKKVKKAASETVERAKEKKTTRTVEKDAADDKARKKGKAPAAEKKPAAKARPTRKKVKE